jgi:hypothetical protein
VTWLAEHRFHQVIGICMIVVGIVLMARGVV